MVTETETPPAGYEFLNYGLIIIGAAGIVGSLFAYAKQKRLP